VDVIKSFQISLITGLDRLLGLQEVEAPRVFRQSAHEVGKVVRPTPQPPFPPPPPGDIPGIHFCYRLSRPQGYSAAGRIKSMKNPNDPIWNGTSDLPAFRALIRVTNS